MKYNKKTDEQDLIIGLQKGSEAAFNEIFERYHKLVFYVANRTCHNEADAQDITQETFLTIRDRAQDIRNPKYFRLWVYRIISSKCKNMFYKNRRMMYPTEDDFFETRMMENRNDFIPHQDMHFKNDQEVLNHLIDQLSEGQRLVMIMYYMEQFSISEIAEIMELPEGTVKSRMSAGRKALQALVEQYEARANQKLDFHNLTQAIPLALSASLLSYKVPALPMMKMNPSASFVHTVTSFLSTHIVTGIIATGILVGGGYLAHSYINNNNQSQEAMPSNQDKLEEAILFQPIQVEGEVIDTSKKGFYALQLYACCEKDIEDMSEDELIQMKPLYEEMKVHGGAYYDHLVESGWASAFEEKVIK